MAANARPPTCSIHTRSAMNALSWGRCFSVILSAPGASQSMSASAHCRSLILTRMSSRSSAIADCSSDLFGDGGNGPEAESHGLGVRARQHPLGLPDDPGVPLRDD